MPLIADCGRLSNTDTPWPLLHVADIVAVAVLPTVAGVRLAARWLSRLRDRIGENTMNGGRFRLLVIGDGPYPAVEVAAALEIGLLAALPEDRQAARHLEAGGGRGLARRPLWRSLVKLADQLADQTDPSEEQPERSADASLPDEHETSAAVAVSAVHAAAS